MNNDKTWLLKFEIHNLNISLEDLVHSVLDDRISRDEFWKRWDRISRLRRLCECSIDIGMDKFNWDDLEGLGWKELEKHGHLCNNDYKCFDLTRKYGMTPEDGERRYDEFLAASHNGSAPVLKTECGLKTDGGSSPSAAAI